MSLVEMAWPVVDWKNYTGLEGIVNSNPEAWNGTGPNIFRFKDQS